jgi:hypothetical protein
MGLMVGHGAQANTKSASEIVNFLNALKIKHSRELDTLDRDLLALIQIPDASDFRSKEAEILTKQKRRVEITLKIDFLDQLTTQFDRHYSGQPLRMFVSSRVSALMARELGLGTSRTDTNQNSLRFLLELRSALIESNVKDTKVFDFLEGYLNRNEVSDLKNKAANNYSEDPYSNDYESSKAKDSSLENAGDFVDQVWPKKEKADSSKENPPSSKIETLKRERILEPFGNWRALEKPSPSQNIAL